MRHHLRRSRRKFLSPNAWKVRLVFWAGAVLVGLVCALFALLAEFANDHFYEFAQANPLLPLLITPLALAAIAWVTVKFFPGAKGSGIPQSIAALDSNDKSAILSLKIALGKILLTLAGLFSGASIGREGPSVQIGASIMHAMSSFARFPPHYMERGLVTIAVVIAGVTAIGVLGNYHYFGISNAVMPDAQAWLAILICGVLGGLLGGLFANSLIFGSRKLYASTRDHPVIVALVAGMMLALFAYLSGYSASGTGYREASQILAGTATFDPWYPLLKIGTTLSSYLSGIPGGIFAPSLATGAGVGANLGHWIPVAPMSVMVLLGMVAYFSGVVQSPLTAFVIVLEMTANQNLILALIATSFIAYGASHLVCPKPLYRTLAEAFLRGHKPPASQ